jgi:epoxyqueuosine reductase
MKVKISIEQLKEKVLELGWDDMGITSPKIPDEDIKAYLSWLDQGNHATLAYMENQIRLQPQLLLEGAKTAIILIASYKQEKKEFRKDAGLIASYARGRKYHNVLYKRIKKLISWLEEYSNQKGIAKAFCDSAPVLEKALAVKAGLGWFGKNTLLIHRKFGTFTFISGLLTTLDFPLEENLQRLPRCGSCTRCLDACPTQALYAPYSMNANLCLSYHLIESKEKIPDDIAKKNPGYVFGCDICQDVCPHNRRPPLSLQKEFQEESGFGAYLTPDKLKSVSDHPEHLFGTPLQRQGVHRLQENLSKVLQEK